MNEEFSTIDASDELRPRDRIARYAVISGCVLLLFTLHGVFRTTLVPYGATGERARLLLTGDEPSYLLMAVAMARGDGLNVGPTQQEGGYRSFRDKPVFRGNKYSWHYYGAVGLKPWLDRSEFWGEARVLQLSPLFPVMASVLVRDGGNMRWRISVWQAVLSCLVCMGILTTISRSKVSAGELLEIGLALIAGMCGIPASYYVAEMYPETITGLLLLSFLFCQCSDRSVVRMVGNLLLCGALFATPRVVPGIGVASAVVVWQAFGRRSWSEMGVVFVTWLAFLAFNLRLWGMPLPPAAAAFVMQLGLDSPYNATTVLVGSMFATAGLGLVIAGWRFPRVRRPLLWGGLGVMGLCLVVGLLLQGTEKYGEMGKMLLPTGLVRVFMGRDVGLFLLSPFLILGAVAGVYYMVGMRSRQGWVWLALFWGVVMVASSYPDFRAGRCPMGRYQVIPAYLLLFPLVRVLSGDRSKWQERLLWASCFLGPVSIAIGLKVAMQPNYWFRKYHPLFGYAAVQPYYKYFPDPGRATFVLEAIAWMGVLLLPLVAADLVMRLRCRAR